MSGDTLLGRAKSLSRCNAHTSMRCQDRSAPVPLMAEVLNMDQSLFLMSVSPRPSATCASLRAPGMSCMQDALWAGWAP